MFISEIYLNEYYSCIISGAGWDKSFARRRGSDERSGVMRGLCVRCITDLNVNNEWVSFGEFCLD